MKKENTNSSNDPWDWPFLLYMSKRYLHYSDNEFWRSSPQKIFSLIDAHIDIESGNNKGKVKIANV